MPDLLKTIEYLKSYLKSYDMYFSRNLQDKVYDPGNLTAEIIPLNELKNHKLVWLEAKFLDYPLCVYVTGFRDDNTVGFKVHPDEPEWFFYTEDPEGYNKVWRCWSIYPSYERRKEVEWLN